MTKYEELSYMMDKFLDSQYDPFEFSDDLMCFLFVNYDEMFKENPQATNALNEEIPDICAGYELGTDASEFQRKIRYEYDKALNNDI